MSFTPGAGGTSLPTPAFLGTFRVTDVDAETGKFRASGDLYEAPANPAEPPPNRSDLDWISAAYDAGTPGAGLTKLLDPMNSGKSSSIPHFAIDDYRYYLEVLTPAEDAPPLTLEVIAHEYDAEGKQLEAHIKQTLKLTRIDENTYEGSLLSGRQEQGRFNLRWISESVRRATLRLFAFSPESASMVTKVKLPGLNSDAMTAGLANARAEDLACGSNPSPVPVTEEKIPVWGDLFKRVGWQLDVAPEPDRTAPAGTNTWTAYDLGGEALGLRQDIGSGDWVYDLMCVSSFENNAYLGIMFDAEATDLNERPRESAAVAALQEVKSGGAKKHFQDILGGAAYYRTALHEVGHAMNLTHNFRGRSLMNTTGPILQLPVPAENGKPRIPLRFDVEWNFSPDEAEWLRHAPDIAVRPGGISRRGVRLRCDMRPTPPAITLKAASDLILTVRPVVAYFPWGAPVRLNYELSNLGAALDVPKDLSLRGGYVMGRVTGPDRVSRFFRSAFRCCDTAVTKDRLTSLDSNETRHEGMTILRGIDGPLFPEPGAYTVEVEIRWDAQNRTNRVVGQTNVTVAAANAADPAQAVAANMILNDATMMPALVQGLIDQAGLRVLSVALRSTTLAPHYLPTALKCEIMGARRGVDWDDPAKLGAKTDPVAIPPPSTPSRPGMNSRSLEESLPSGPVRRIIQTQREERQLESVAKRADDRQDSPEVEKVNLTQVVLSEATSAWLDRVRDFTAPTLPEPDQTSVRA